RALAVLSPDQLQQLHIEGDEGTAEVAAGLEQLALNSDGAAEDRRQLFELAFDTRRAIASEQTSRGYLVHLLLLAVDALLAERSPELTMLLRELPPDRLAVPRDVSWAEEVMLRAARALLLLLRRADGWTDIKSAAAEIHRLR